MGAYLDPDTAWTNTAPSDAEDVVSYGDPAQSAPLTLADAYQLEVLYGAVPDLVFGCEVDTTSQELAILVPPFVDRVRVGVVGTGQGTVTVDGTYAIPITAKDATLLDANYGEAWGGPAAIADQISLSPPSTGVPWVWTPTVVRTSDCRVYELRFQWGRSSSAI